VRENEGFIERAVRTQSKTYHQHGSARDCADLTNLFNPFLSLYIEIVLSISLDPREQDVKKCETYISVELSTISVVDFSD